MPVIPLPVDRVIGRRGMVRPLRTLSIVIRSPEEGLTLPQRKDRVQLHRIQAHTKEGRVLHQ